MMYRFPVFTMMDTQSRMKNAAESRLGYKDYNAHRSRASAAPRAIHWWSRLKRSERLFLTRWNLGATTDGCTFFVEEKKAPGRERVLAALSINLCLQFSL